MNRVGVLTIAFLLVVLISTAALADEFKMRSSPLAPAATATIHVKSDRNGNLELKLEAKHLAPPDRLAQPHTVYVVWIQAPGKDPQQLGVLRVNTDDMAASLATKTPYRSFDLFVTAEDSPQPASPSSAEVLRGSVQE
jgi:hypothetical protein